MSDELHVVAFNVPWPADYGGVMDVYYRLRALHEAGIGVHLHCFTYGRPVAPQLETLCASVEYYRRNMSPLLHLGRRPFIVSSRRNDALLRRLEADRLPVLLEGVHCCSPLEVPSLAEGRCVMVRAHNVEADYYSQLADAERRLPRKAYLAVEARKLLGYERILTRATAVLAVTPADQQYFTALGCRRVEVMTCAHPHREVVAPTGRGSYAIYHGNLSVPENEEAALYLIDNVFSRLDYPLVVAGHAPSARLRERVASRPNVSLVADPDGAALDKLVAEAQANILVTHQATGLKLKLLNALFAGRHCVVNSPMVAGTGLESLCEVSDSADGLCRAVERIMGRDFTDEDVRRRSVMLQPYVVANSVRPLLGLLAEA